MIPLDPGRLEVPSVFPTPFGPSAPHPIARRAAGALQSHLVEHLPREAVHGPLGGKMFGVLVVHDARGRLCMLSAFAGMLLGERTWPGFVPPACEHDAFERLWQTRGAQVEALGRAVSAESPGPHRQMLREAQRVASRRLLADLRGTYNLRNYDGATRGLTGLFAPRPIPGGAGDCAAVKLLQQAYRLDARPVALAEFWWGDASRSGDRRHGVFYPACRRRCAEILPFMLEGLPCEPSPLDRTHDGRS